MVEGLFVQSYSCERIVWSSGTLCISLRRLTLSRDDFKALIALSRLALPATEKKAVALQHESVASLFEGRSLSAGGMLMQKASRFDGWARIDTDVEIINNMGGHIVTIRDDRYPPLLKQIPDAPVVLYTKGPLTTGSNTLAIVGSRKATPEGVNLAGKIGETLSAAGITVVSGFARGIDSAAHRGAVKERKGSTVAVFGCGLDICYPPENKSLYGSIAEEGLIVTEYGPGEEPLPFHFPARNRIIAGISKGILVIEASRKSGSLITARLGLEYGREVMAVPGSIFRREYEGANGLIKEGARLIDSIDEIIDTCFPGFHLETRESPAINDDEQQVFSFIGSEQIHVDEIIDRSRMEAKRVMAILTMLEMKEIIREVPGGFYIRR